MSREKSEFTKKVYEAVRRIPKGEVASYKEVAEMAGYPGAFRAVGTVLSKNIDPEVPCHRVIRSDGRVGGYQGGRGGGEEIKRARLEEEGVSGVL